MKKNITIMSVYNVQPEEMTARLKEVKGLRFSEPKVNENNFCETKITRATKRQWAEVMRIW